MERINRTDMFYRNGPVDLWTEYTVCETLSSGDSPAMKNLHEPAPFGALVGRLLRERGLLDGNPTVCEIGGGQGSLMRGFLEHYGGLIDRVVMVDISRAFLERQRRALSSRNAATAFIQGAAEELVPALKGIDLCIINEVAGDLETWVSLDAADLPAQVARLVERYGLHVPRTGRFHFNMGAIRLVEAVCGTGWKLFLSEHACDPLIPADMPYLGRGLDGDGFPREISLKGHREYTVRFDHLLSVARGLGRRTATGSMAELVGLIASPRTRAVFCGTMTASDEHAVLFELLDHIREYRWMVVY